MQNQNSKFKIKLKDRAYDHAVRVIQFLDVLPQDTSMGVIKTQLLKSATSIGANIIEAQASSSRKDFTNFFSHALKSANESVYWLGLLKDAKKINEPTLENLLQETKELSNILGSSILTLKHKK